MADPKSQDTSNADETRNQTQKPDSTGTNARPRTETISQTGPGIPDDTSRPVEISPEEERRIEESIRSGSPRVGNG